MKILSLCQTVFSPPSSRKSRKLRSTGVWMGSRATKVRNRMEYSLVSVFNTVLTSATCMQGVSQLTTARPFCCHACSNCRYAGAIDCLSQSSQSMNDEAALRSWWIRGSAQWHAYTMMPMRHPQSSGACKNGATLVPRHLAETETIDGPADLRAGNAN